MKIIAAHQEDNPYRKDLVKGLVAYNDANGPPENWRFVGFYALNDADELIGGVQGIFEWDWLHIKHLWVEEPSSGLGRKLMEAIEDYARQENMTGSLVDTFAFQAKGFYEKMGYEVFGEIENAAGSYARFFMKKNLK